MVPYIWTKRSLSIWWKRSIVCYRTHKQTGFTENGCNGNQPQPSEVLFYSIDANSFSSFPKQDLTVKQAYRVTLSFVRRRKLNLTKYACLTVKSCFGNSCFQCFLRAFFGYNLILCHTHWTNHPLSRDRS